MTLSLDDLYLTRAERDRLAAQIHPLFATRGVPGTHAVGMGLDIIENILAGRALELPRFDKSNDDRAEIVADDPIAVKVEAEVWGEAMADMLDEIRKGCIAEGIAAGVRDVGVVLAQHFPRRHDDTNELPDRLIEL